MKQILTRLSILLMLSGALVWISTSNDAKAFDCVNLSAMWDAMGNCDNEFWTGASPHYDVVQNNPNHCNDQVNMSCPLSSPNYATCASQVYSQCATNAQNSYYNAIGSYGSCLSAAVNPGCFESLEFCPGAQQRAAACESLANEDCCVYSECLNASGIWQCS